MNQHTSKKKLILCLDFDGVIHSYKSGWKGARVIPDPPVPGALEFLVKATQHFQVVILSSRSHQWGGRRAMKKWVFQNLVDLTRGGFGETPYWWRARVAVTAFADPWPDEVRHAAKNIIKSIKWPLFKPPAQITIDDRAITFTGEWPTVETLLDFKPWNKH